MHDDFTLTVKPFDRDSFIELFEHILVHGIQKVHFSSRSTSLLPNASWSLPPRIDFTITGSKHMLFPYSGKVLNLCLCPGEVHYSPSMTWKRAEWDCLHRMASIIYTPDYIRFTFIDHNRLNDYYATHGADIFYHTSTPISSAGKAVLRALDHVAEEPAGDENANALMTVLLRMSISTLKQDKKQPPDKRHQTFLMIDNYLRENYLRPISRASIAEKFRLTPSYVSRLYKEFGETSFLRTQRHLRMEHAAMLLKNTFLSIDEVTEVCAYSSTTFFIAAFKKIYGLSPGRFRRKYISQENLQDHHPQRTQANPSENL